MPRLASLCLPDLAIDRIRRASHIAARRDLRIMRSMGEGWSDSELPLPRPSDGPPPHASHGEEQNHRILTARGGGWRPGARWAREQQPQDLVLHLAEGALVTARRDGNRDLLAAICPQGRALGLVPGMPLSKARILVSGLDVRPADPEGDAAWLQRLGLFAARRWTPRAAPSGGDGLWLDLSGVAHLFGGERLMCKRILAFCRRLGFRARIAVAGTTGAAHALARLGASPLVLCPAGCEADAIAPLPLAALRLDEDLLERTHRLGLETIGELITMPRGPLQRRFGSDLLLRLDQALGRLAEPFDPIAPEDPPSVLLRFLEPIATAEAIAEAAGEAMRRLVVQLREAGYGVRRLVLACERVDGDVQQAAIGTARATRDGAHLLKLIGARIETLEPGFGFERIRLIAARIEPLAAQVIEGKLSGTRSAPDLAPLIDLLATRLGARRLFRLSALESDIPERSVRRTGVLDETAAWRDWARPVRLLSPPEPVEQVMSEVPDGAPRRFQWRGRTHHVTAADGPERIYGEWWRRKDEEAAVRDYFQVEDKDGARFWLFRKGDGEDPATGDRSWHVHGLFG